MRGKYQNKRAPMMWVSAVSNVLLHNPRSFTCDRRLFIEDFELEARCPICDGRYLITEEP